MDGKWQLKIEFPEVIVSSHVLVDIPLILGRHLLDLFTPMASLLEWYSKSLQEPIELYKSST